MSFLRWAIFLVSYRPSLTASLASVSDASGRGSHLGLVVFWALAYFQLRRGRLFKGAFNTTMTLVNVFIFLVGLFMLTAGMYTSGSPLSSWGNLPDWFSVDAIVTDYSGTTRKVFGCVNNAL
jgi:hypothetical protein